MSSSSIDDLVGKVYGNTASNNNNPPSPTEPNSNDNSGKGKKEKKDEDKDDDQEEENILELVEENCSEFFLDQYGLPYTAVTVNEHVETMSLHSKRFRNWLCKLFYDRTGDLIKAEDLAGILNILKARSEFGNNIKQLHLRVGNTQNLNSQRHVLQPVLVHIVGSHDRR